jgi:flavin-binding protein dodecin
VSTVDVIELIGESKTSFEDAVKSAVDEARKTVRDITGVHVEGFSAVVKNDQIVAFRANVMVAFVYHHEYAKKK